MIEPQRMTIAEFDDWISTAPEGFIYELQDGLLYSFATGSEEHGLLCSRIGGWLLGQPFPRPCRTFLGSIAVRRKPERPSSVVPDAVVTCEERCAGRNYVTAPKLVVEVISPGSVTNDLTRKPRIYDAVESIAEYLVIDSRNVWARLFRRDADGSLISWGEDSTRGDSVITLRTVDLAFTLDELYDDIIAPS